MGRPRERTVFGWTRTLCALVALACSALAMALDPTVASPAAPFDVAQPLNGRALGRHLAAFSDATGAMDLDAAIALDRQGRFVPATRDYPNFSPSTDPVWLRVDVVNSGATAVKWVLEMSHPFADLVEVYAPDGLGGFKAHLTGDSRPVGSRSERRRTFVFPLVTEAGAEQRYYLRIQGSEAIVAAFNAWTHEELDEVSRVEELGVGVFYGIVLGLFAYNLFLWASFRDQPTRWYLIYLVLMSFAYASFFGYTALYVWGDYPWFAGGRDIQFFYFAGYTFYFQFARSVLDLRHHTPRLDGVMRGIIGVGAVSTVLMLLLSTHANHLLVSASQLTLVILPLAAAIAWRRGYRPARYYLLATSIFVFAIILLGLWNVGLIDTSPRFFYATMSVGTAAELVLFSVAMADRINMLRGEKEKAQIIAEETLRRAAEELERKVEARTLELWRAVERAEKLARTDELTGVMNRRAFFEAAEGELRRVRRYGGSCAIAVFDLDHFKSINDSHGHAVGDAALVSVVERAREVLRDVDCIGRIGGEEFAILLPNAGLGEAAAVAERLRARLAEHAIDVYGKRLGFTASFGIAEATPAMEELSELINAADAAMYSAKREGRNRVVAALSL